MRHAVVGDPAVSGQILERQTWIVEQESHHFAHASIERWQARQLARYLFDDSASDLLRTVKRQLPAIGIVKLHIEPRELFPLDLERRLQATKQSIGGMKGVDLHN